MYYIHGILLNNCSYSNNAKQLLETYNIPNKLISITHEEKDKFKYDEINTFPQIYVKKENTKGSILIGGYDNLNELFTLFYKNYNKDNIENIMNKYKLSRKLVLRIIEMFN
jgi:glutaredoxin-related protein